MEVLKVFSEIKRIVRQEKNYRPRNYETVGGMWTTDTWEFNGVIYQLMDEGYTDRIFVKKLDLDVVVYCDNTVNFNKGNINNSSFAVECSAKNMIK